MADASADRWCRRYEAAIKRTAPTAAHRENRKVKRRITQSNRMIPRIAPVHWSMFKTVPCNTIPASGSGNKEIRPDAPARREDPLPPSTLQVNATERSSTRTGFLRATWISWNHLAIHPTTRLEPSRSWSDTCRFDSLATRVTWDRFTRLRTELGRKPFFERTFVPSDMRLMDRD